MSATQIRQLIAEINSLLSRPLGSAAKVSSLELINQREQLKHLRSRLENLSDSQDVGELEQECKLLIEQIQTQQQSQFDTPKFNQLQSYKTTQIVSSAPVPDWTKETNTMANSTNPTLLGINEQITANLQQTIQQAIQQVVQQSVQQSVRQTLEQVLTVERALMIGEISANLRGLLESHRRSQLNADLQELEQRRQMLHNQVSQLETERRSQIEQITKEQQLQQQKISESFDSLNSYLREQMKWEIDNAVAQTLSNIQLPATISSGIANNYQEELIDKVKNQTDQFLLTLDAMFGATFKSLDSDIQGYKSSLAEKLEQMEDIEQRGESILNALVERMSHQIEATSTVPTSIEPAEDESEVSNFQAIAPEPTEYVDLELIEQLLATPSSENLDLDRSSEKITIPEILTENNNLNIFADFNLEESIEPVTVSEPVEDISVSASESEEAELKKESTVNYYSTHTESENPNLSELSEPSNLPQIPKEDDFGDFLKELDPSSYEAPDFRRDVNLLSNSQVFDPADFDPDAETQIISYAESLTQIEQINTPITKSLNLSASKLVNLEDNSEFLAWLNTQPENPTTRPADRLPTNENETIFLDWLDTKTDSNELPNLINSTTEANSLIPEFPQQDSLSSASWLGGEIHNDTLVNTDNIESSSISEAPENLIDMIGLEEADYAINSDESLILLPDSDRELKKTNNWIDDLLIRELNADLDNLDAGIGGSPLIAANLDMAIRNTPFSEFTSMSNKSSKSEEQFNPEPEAPRNLKSKTDEPLPEIENLPATLKDENAAFENIMDLFDPLNSAEDSLSEAIASIPEIIEDPEALFADSSSDTSGSLSPSNNDEIITLVNPEFGEDPELLFLDSFLDLGDISTQINSRSIIREIPEIIEDPEALFAEPTSGDLLNEAYEQNSIDSIDDLLTNLNSEIADPESLFADNLFQNLTLVSPSQSPSEVDSQASNPSIVTDLDALFDDEPTLTNKPNVSANSGDNFVDNMVSLLADLPTDFAISSSTVVDLSGDRSPDTSTTSDLANFANILTHDEIGEIVVDIADTSSHEFKLDIVDVPRASNSGLELSPDQEPPKVPELSTTEKTDSTNLNQDLDELIQGLEVSLDQDLNDILQGLTPFEEFETVLQDFSTNDEFSKVLDGLNTNLFDQQFEQSEEASNDFFASLEDDKLNQFADQISTDEGDREDIIKSLDLSESSGDNDVDLPESEEELKLTEFADLDAQIEDWDDFINSNALALEQHGNLSALSKEVDSSRDMDAAIFNFAERDRQGYFSKQVSENDEVSDNFTDVDFLALDTLVGEDSNALLVQILPPEITSVIDYNLDDTWFLGVDFGSSSIRASLINGNTAQIYPLSFEENQDYLDCTALFESGSGLDDPMQLHPQLISLRNHLESNSDKPSESSALISHFKHLLKLGLPYRGISSWQPILQWSETEKITLRWLQSVLKELLVKIQSTAINHNIPDVQSILHNLSGVVLGHPTDWSDTYILSVREAVLKSGLVGQAEQVMLIEEAIAPLLSSIHEGKSLLRHSTLLIDAGAATTSLYLVKASGSEVKRSDIHGRGLDYAGEAINQDIVTQLLYPHWRLITNPERDNCNLEHLSLPTPGEPDVSKRVLLQQYLISSSIGRQLLQLAEQLKIELSSNIDRDQWSGDIQGQPLMVLRRELESMVLLPFIQRLNRELNALLSNAGLIAEDIGEVWQLGGTMNIPSIARWLQQKLPNVANFMPLSSFTTANGLGLALMYRSLLNVSRQQYSDYFLLQEICRLNLRESVTLNSLMQQLQSRGVNVRSCRDRILNILQGDLPSGLFPWQEPEKEIILADPSISSSLFTGRLFELETDGSYQPDLNKFQLLSNYLQAILANMQQTLNEPLLFPEFTTRDRMPS